LLPPELGVPGDRDVSTPLVPSEGVLPVEELDELELLDELLLDELELDELELDELELDELEPDELLLDDGADGRHPVCAGLVRPIPWLRSHSYPAFASEPPGSWPCGFLLSALPTHAAHGLPTAWPPPLPFSAGAPLRVESYGPCVLAPWPLKSALDGGCGSV
jgi:hypothetical protein